MVSYFSNMNFHSSLTNSSSLQMENIVGDKRMDEERRLIFGRGWRGRAYHLRWIDGGRGLTLKSLWSLCIVWGETAFHRNCALSSVCCREAQAVVGKVFLHFLQSPDENFSGLPYMPRAPVKACVFGHLCLDNASGRPVLKYILSYLSLTTGRCSWAMQACA